MASLLLKSLLLVLAISYVCSSSFITTIMNRFNPQNSNYTIGTNIPVNEQSEQTIETGDNSYLPESESEKINQSKSPCLATCLARYSYLGTFCYEYCRKHSSFNIEL
jgi:hypothetical protein